MAAPAYHTAEMVRALNDVTPVGPRFETVYGELLVTPSPRKWHQVVVGRLVHALAEYLDREPVAHVFFSPSDVASGPDTLVQPDVFALTLEEARTPDWPEVARLLLTVEVLSPSTARADRFTKRRLYQEQGVLLYWIVDADARVVEVWTPADRFPRVEIEALEWLPPGAGSPFRLHLHELFRPI